MKKIVTTVAAIALMAGCQHLPGTKQPAVLDAPTSKVQLQLQQSVSAALGSDIRLSQHALTRNSRLTIDAPQSKTINDQSHGLHLGKPDHFQLWKQGKKCVLEHEETGQTWVLQAASCVEID